MSEWISVKDRLPEKVGAYLIYRNHKKPVTRIQWFMAYDIYSKDIDQHERHFYMPDGRQDCHVTHWMPLPEPPNE